MEQVLKDNIVICLPLTHCYEKEALTQSSNKYKIIFLTWTYCPNNLR